MKKKEWFAEWFDSEYYHILYKNRDFTEAEFFIDNLIDFLKPEKDASILDLACGAGRHSVFLHKKGYNVTGVDLAANSIDTAKQYEQENLLFDVHDMREVYHSNAYDYIFSMFTSFGYFNDAEDNVKMLSSVNSSLKESGVFVLDFMNAHKVIKNLVPDEVKEVDGIIFHIKRFVDDGFIKKNIRFTAEGEDYNYTEKVQGIFLEEMKSLFEKANLNMIHTFGDYKLNEFNEQTSDRLIIIASK